MATPDVQEQFCCPFGGSLRVIILAETPYFVGKDVCLALGYKNPRKAMQVHCKRDSSQFASIMTSHGTQQMRVLKLPSLVLLIERCKLVQAKEFRQWMLEHVLPCYAMEKEYLEQAQLYMPPANEINTQLWCNSLGDSIRSTLIDGVAYFAGVDICRALAYANSRQALNDHCRNPITRYAFDTPRGKQLFRVINEADVYRLILRSKLPKAIEFERWLFETVLPSIRKTGRYVQFPIDHDRVRSIVNSLLATTAPSEQQTH